MQNLKSERSDYRLRLEELIVQESELGVPIPTTCATDGLYAIERLLSADLVACTAVAVEGLTPPSEKQVWDGPRHSSFVIAQPHDEHTDLLLKAITLGRELLLAIHAPHELGPA
jgi:hypothetical protein